MTTTLTWQEQDCLSLLLNLEYLQAEFYVRAVSGKGLDPGERGGSSAPCTGGKKIAFETPLIAAIVDEFARVERQHIAFLRTLFAEFDEPFVAAPDIDLEQSFDIVIRASGLSQEGQVFDAFANETNFLLAAYVVEDVVVSAYRGASNSISNKKLQSDVFGIMTAEAAQSGAIRTALLAAGFGIQTNAISYYRQSMTDVVGTAYASNDHGVGDLRHSGVINTDGHSAIWPRSDRQVLNILFGGVDRRAGLFFPNGLGATRRERTLREIYTVHLPDLARVDKAPVIQLSALPSHLVTLPPLGFVESQLQAYELWDNVTHQPWSETSYASHAPTTYEISDALSYGAVGILVVDDRVVHETLWHTDPVRHFYHREGDTIVLRSGRAEVLAGTTITILVGAAENYWHSLLDAIARLLLVPDAVWERASTLLIPSTGMRLDEIIQLFDLPKHIEVRTVHPEEALHVETLIFPSSIHGLFDYHPTIMNGIYDRLLANLPDESGDTPRHVFIDRRGSGLRRLLNEDELVSALPTFQPVRLETMSLVEQIRLFRNADIVVAPHGAGLTNIGFCRPGTLIVELMMDAYCNWCYRRIAAIRRLSYRCVLGKASARLDASQTIHQRTWTVPIQEVLDVVKENLDRSMPQKIVTTAT